MNWKLISSVMAIIWWWNVKNLKLQNRLTLLKITKEINRDKCCNKNKNLHNIWILPKHLFTFSRSKNILPPVTFISKNALFRFIEYIMYLTYILTKYIKNWMNLKSVFLLINVTGGSTPSVPNSKKKNNHTY